MRTELGFYYGLLVAAMMLLSFFALVDLLDELPEQAEKAIYECELTIPREQHCVITAVPEGLER